MKHAAETLESKVRDLFAEHDHLAIREEFDREEAAWLASRLEELAERGGIEEAPELADAIRRAIGERLEPLSGIAFDEHADEAVASCAARLLFRRFELVRILALHPSFSIPPAALRPSVRAAMIDGLRDREDVVGLRLFLRDGNPSIVHRATKVLNALAASEQAAPAIRAELERVLRRVVSPADMIQTWEMLEELVPKIALEVLQVAVRRIEGEGGPEERPDLVSEFGTIFERRPDLGLRLVYYEFGTLGSRGMAARLLYGLVDSDRIGEEARRIGFPIPASDDDWFIRLGAVYGMGDRGDLEGLRSFTGDPSEDVREAAEELLSSPPERESRG